MDELISDLEHIYTEYDEKETWDQLQDLVLESFQDAASYSREKCSPFCQLVR